MWPLPAQGSHRHLDTVFITIILFLITINLNVFAESGDPHQQQQQLESDDNSDDDRSRPPQQTGRILTMQIPGTPVRRIVDPQGTWMHFMRHSERTNRQHRAKNARKTKQLNALRGATGPQGPRGPPGPPGAEVTRDILLAEFRDVVREAAERKAQSTVDAECSGCAPSLLENITGPYLPPLFEVDEAFVVPKMIWGFHCRLENDRKVPRRAFVELTGLYVPFVDGGFLRGEGVDPASGRFSVPRDGIYNFVANLQLKQRAAVKRRIGSGGGGASVARAIICIDSLCQGNASLETVVQIKDAPWYGSLLVTGLLKLQKGQYVSVYVDNSSGDTIRVLETSFFGGSLAGL